MVGQGVEVFAAVGDDGPAGGVGGSVPVLHALKVDCSRTVCGCQDGVIGLVGGV